MTIDRKIIALSALFSFFSCFFPWYGSKSSLAVNQVLWNGFESVGYIGGYLIASFSLASLIILLTPIVDESIQLTKKLPWTESAILFFLTGQSAFVSLIFIPVYSQYALLQAANSGTRYGIYMALFGTLFASMGSLVLMQREKREQAVQSFSTIPRAHRSLEEEDTAEWEGDEYEEDVEQEAMEFDDEESAHDTMTTHHYQPQQSNHWGNEEPLGNEYPHKDQIEF